MTGWRTLLDSERLAQSTADSPRRQRADHVSSADASHRTYAAGFVPAEVGVRGRSRSPRCVPGGANEVRVERGFEFFSPTSMRARPSWSRTRNCSKPHVRRTRSAFSTRERRSSVTSRPVGIREERHAIEGLSATERSYRGRVPGPRISRCRVPAAGSRRPVPRRRAARAVESPVMEAFVPSPDVDAEFAGAVVHRPQPHRPAVVHRMSSFA